MPLSNFTSWAVRPRRSALMRLLVSAGWFVVGVIIIGALTCFWAFDIKFIAMLPGVLGLLVIVALSTALRGSRRRRADAILGHVVTAIDLGLPLPNYLAMAAQSESRGVRKRILWTQAAIVNGESVSNAISVGAGELPPLLQSQIAAAERAGTLKQVLPQLLREEQRHTILSAKARADGAYALVLAILAIVISAVIAIFVLPKYAQILADFKVAQPRITVVPFHWIEPLFAAYVQFFFMLAKGTSFGMETAFALFFIVPMGLGAASFIANAARGLFTSRPNQPVFRWFTDRALWYMPVVGRLIRHRETAAVCETIGQSLQAGQTLPDAIDLATFSSLNGVLRNRMKRWHARVRAGAPVSQAARASAMPALLCDVLGGAQNDTVGAIEFAQRAFANASERLAILIRAVLPVAITLAFSVVVTCIALTIFQPLIALLDKMTLGNTFWVGR